jgi:serine/threonine protein kinase
MAALPVSITKNEMAPISLEGQTLGKYRILEPLGRGGMAQVFKAYHPQLDRYVAVKVLRSDLIEEEEFLKRFRREARAVAGLRHANIVQIFDFDVQDELYFMVMELLEGDTLKAYLNALRQRGERLPLGETVRIFGDVLAGLAYAHSEGVVHRDLKPANIMLTKRGQAVLTDFGIAQILGGTNYTVSGALMGTLNYMAPEQGRDGKCDVRSDVYSLGIAYYEALTGMVPFDADTPLAILMKHINDPLPLPRSIDPKLPEPFERVALKALAKDPDDRYQSAAEMSEALFSAAREAGIHIPERISVPKAGLIPRPRSAQVPVFSGSSRQQIPDSAFAAGDTDITLGKTFPPRSLGGLVERARTFLTPPRQIPPVKPVKVSQSVLAWLGVFLVINMSLFWFSGIFGWEVFGRTWPMEIIGVGLLFAALMAALPNYWLLIPGGILLGNGLIMSYYALTGWWWHWAFLWPLEPIVVGASLVSPFLVRRYGERGLWLTRRLGILLAVMSGAVFVLSLVVAIIRSIASSTA